jgi:hypothetical protein
MPPGAFGRIGHLRETIDVLRVRARLLTASVRVIGLVAGALAAVSPPAVAMVPAAPPGGSVVRVGMSPAQTLDSGSYTAVSQRMDDYVYGVRASDGTLAQIASAGDSAMAIPSDVAGKRILSLSSQGKAYGGGGTVGVVTADGLPHVWGTTAGQVSGAVNALTTAAALGGGGTPAVATQIAVGTNLVGLLLADGRLGVVSIDGSGGYSYRAIPSSVVTERVVQIDAFGSGDQAKSGLVLRVANGGSLIWRPDGSTYGTVVAPFAAVSGSNGWPADPLVDIEASSADVAVAVTAGGSVYAINADGTRADRNVLPSGMAMVGKPVQAAVLQIDYDPDDPIYLVRTDANRLYLIYGGLGESLIGPDFDYRGHVESFDQTSKVVVSISGGVNNFQVIAAIAAPPLVVTTASLADGTVGTAYSQTLTATGGVAPYTWSVIPGSLPDGLTLDASTGVISGTPTGTPGKNSFPVTVTDSAGTPVTAAANLSLTVGAALATVASTMTLSGNPASAVIGAARIVTATVTRPGGIATGTVTFRAGSTAGTALLVDGRAIWRLPSLAVGSHQVSATYAGDATTSPSTAAPVTLEVTKAPATVKAAFKVKGKTARIAKKVTITLTVATAGGVSPQGAVSVTLKGKTTKTLKATVDAAGKATITAKKLKRGTYKATVRYAGNGSVNATSITQRFKV